MPLNLPPSLQLFKPSEPNAQRFLPPIERTVTQVLNFLRGSFDVAANNAIKILRPVIVSALTGENLTVSKVLESLGDSNFRGGSTSYQFHIVQGSFYVLKNTDGSGGDATVNGDATLNGKSNLLGGVNTPTGIKMIAGQVGINGNPVAGQFYSLGAPYFGNTWYFKAPFAGSMVGLSICTYATSAGTMNVYSTGFNTSEQLTAIPVSAGVVQSWKYTFPRNAYPFSADNNLLWKLMMPAANTNVSLTVTPILELAT